jgi:hypothetical protein
MTSAGSNPARPDFDCVELIEFCEELAKELAMGVEVTDDLR